MKTLYFNIEDFIPIRKKIKIWFKRYYWLYLPIVNDHKIKIGFIKNENYFKQGYYPVKIVWKIICIYVKQEKYPDIDVMYYIAYLLKKTKKFSDLPYFRIKLIIKNKMGNNYLFISASNDNIKDLMFIGILESLFNIFYKTRSFIKKVKALSLLPRKFVIYFKNGDIIIINEYKIRYMPRITSPVKKMRRIRKYYAFLYKLIKRLKRDYEFFRPLPVFQSEVEYRMKLQMMDRIIKILSINENLLERHVEKYFDEFYEYLMMTVSGTYLLYRYLEIEKRRI